MLEAMTIYVHLLIYLLEPYRPFMMISFATALFKDVKYQ